VSPLAWLVVGVAFVALGVLLLTYRLLFELPPKLASRSSRSRAPKGG
jgi:hypothetical protein